jgi:hypothetical protein
VDAAAVAICMCRHCAPNSKSSGVLYVRRNCCRACRACGLQAPRVGPSGLLFLFPCLASCACPSLLSGLLTSMTACRCVCCRTYVSPSIVVAVHDFRHASTAQVPNHFSAHAQCQCLENMACRLLDGVVPGAQLVQNVLSCGSAGRRVRMRPNLRGYAATTTTSGVGAQCLLNCDVHLR